jgi:hypothetical protein
MTTSLALVACAIALRAAQPSPSAEAVVAQASAYLAQYEAALGALVAEEDYTQKLSPRIAGRNIVEPGQTRHLVSDFMLVRLKSEEPWTPFRDVISVDGKPVRDRDARLERLFLQPGAEAVQSAAKISDETARYNLGRFHRTVNVPVLALEFLRPGNAARCKFQGPHRERLDDEEVWKIDFKEQNSGRTLIRDGRNDKNVPASGTFWIRVSDGAVLRTTIKMGNQMTNSDIGVRYCAAATLPVLVPCRMSEKYSTRGEQITGVATYANVRQFKVITSESIKD